ncbi:hypothetical protein [Rubrobacter xylanophilus]|uniref:hypothetical protein n=1 Tax=Rubrobacter xylanophilus TaxID=49319 RepID=UPI00117A99F6|nr:hypothetical protein [Rubrobacter xylanophilus]
MKRRAIMLAFTAVAGLVSSRVADRLLDRPERRGVADDLKEAFLKGGASLGATLAASLLVRALIRRGHL